MINTLENKNDFIEKLLQFVSKAVQKSIGSFHRVGRWMMKSCSHGIYSKFRKFSKIKFYKLLKCYAMIIMATLIQNAMPNINMFLAMDIKIKYD